jgi:hypothetical protein
MEARTISVALAGLRQIGGEPAVLAGADARAADRLDDPAPLEDQTAREIEPTGVEVVRA